VVLASLTMDLSINTSVGLTRARLTTMIMITKMTSMMLIIMGIAVTRKSLNPKKSEQAN
jgi:hypothetical protein